MRLWVHGLYPKRVKFSLILSSIRRISSKRNWKKIFNLLMLKLDKNPGKSKFLIALRMFFKNIVEIFMSAYLLVD